MKHYKLAMGKDNKPLQQGSSDEWLNYRKEGGKIGAVAFSTFLVSKGITENPYSAGILESIALEIYDTLNPTRYKSTWKAPYQKFGNLVEPLIKRELYKKHPLATPFTLECVDNPRVYSSYDGLDLTNMYLYEVKTSKDIEHLYEFDLKFYLGQMIHELFVVHGENIPKDRTIGELVVLPKKELVDLNKLGESLIRAQVRYNESGFFAIYNDRDKMWVNIDMTYQQWKALCNEYLALYDQVNSVMSRDCSDSKDEVLKLLQMAKEQQVAGGTPLAETIQQVIFMEPSHEREDLINNLLVKMVKL